MRPDNSSTRGWTIAYWLLLATWLICGALVMSRVRAGLLTSYGADLTQPAWLYIVARALNQPERRGRGFFRRLIGGTPELAAIALFLGSTATEVSQLLWPQGFFRGVFDPLDIAAYGIGIAICYYCERRSLIPAIAEA